MKSITYRSKKSLIALLCCVATLQSGAAFADTKIADNSANFGNTVTLRKPDGVLEVVGGTSVKPTLVIRSTGNDTDNGLVADGVSPPNMIVQSNGNVGIGTTVADAKLDVRGEIKVGSTVAVCNAALTGSIRANAGTLEYCNGSSWNAVQNNTVGDVKYAAIASDHQGWVLLNGRAVSSLTAGQQANAVALGIGANLPNANNRTLMQTGGLLASGGSNSVVLTQANLPNVNFTGTTSSNGDHNHTLSRRSNPDNGAFDSGDGRRFESSAATTDRAVLGNFSTSTTGAHIHSVTVASGGSGVAVDITPAFISVNTFIYLGN